MKLLTFEADKKEQWGVVINNKETEVEYALVPQMFENLMPRICHPTSSHKYIADHKFFDGNWPTSVVELLEVDDGLEKLQRIHDFAQYYLFNEDFSLLRYCAYALDQIKIKAPIPRPKFYWGLVQNCTSFIRNQPNRHHAYFYPQGHQRPMTCAVGQDEYVSIEESADRFGYNIELGFVIGKKGKYIKAEQAMDYVAGYVNIIDLQANNVIKDYGERYGEDFFVNATASWCAKMQDTSCPMGPYLVTTDEIYNLYSLNAYTRENNMVRDSAHTSNTLLGVERVIEYCSSFRTLYPGDVIHLGTIGVDGKSKIVDWDNLEENIILEGEIEKLGCLKVPIKFIDGAWSSDDNKGNKEPASPIIRDLIKQNKDSISKFNIDEVSNFWTLFANYKQTEEIENMKPNIDVTRYLNNPASALTTKQHTSLSRYATDLEISAEICFVVKKIARKVSLDNAKDYILGYSPMISINDQSFQQLIKEPSTLQEKDLPKVYARWGDGYNIMMDTPIELDKEPSGKISLSIDDVGEIEITANDYLRNGEYILSYISKYITLLPGDVISLGRLEKTIRVDNDVLKKGFVGSIKVEGLAEFRFSVNQE